MMPVPAGVVVAASSAGVVVAATPAVGLRRLRGARVHAAAVAVSTTPMSALFMAVMVGEGSGGDVLVCNHKTLGNLLARALWRAAS